MEKRRNSPMRRREVSPLCLPSPTHPLKDLNKAQRLQEQAKVHPQASHPGRSHSIQQEPTPPSAHRPAQAPPYMGSPCAPPCHTPATPTYPTLGWPHPVLPYARAGPTQSYLTLGLFSPKSEAGGGQPPWEGRAQLRGVGATATEDPVCGPGKWRSTYHRKEQLRPFCGVRQQRCPSFLPPSLPSLGGCRGCDCLKPEGAAAGKATSAAMSGLRILVAMPHFSEEEGLEEE